MLLENQLPGADNNLDSDTTMCDALDPDNTHAISQKTDGDHDSGMVDDSEEHELSLDRKRNRGKIVCQTCQRRKVKCSGQYYQQPIQPGLQCDFCVENGAECCWNQPKRAATETTTRRRPNTAGQAGGSQEASERDRTHTQIKSACVECKRRKQKCSGERPSCQFCTEKQHVCSYEVADGMTRTEDLKQKVQEATEKGSKLAKLVCAMQRGTQEQSSTLLARLRVGASVDDLLDPETDPNRFPEYIRNGPRGAHSVSESLGGPANSPLDMETPLSATSNHSFTFSMPPPKLSPADTEQANDAFKKGYPS